MDNSQTSPFPHPISTPVGALAALLPSERTEPFPELPVRVVCTQPKRQCDASMGIALPPWPEEIVELHYSYRVELKGDLRQLPFELRDMIMAYVLDTCEEENDGKSTDDHRRRRCGRERLSRLSLVCRRWSHVFRRRLFERLHLRSRSDVHFLDSMLRRPHSRWLSAAVKRLHLGVGRVACIGLERVLLMLSRGLPSLQALHHYHPASDKRESLRPCLLPSLQRYISLRTLELWNIEVSNFSLLVRLLGSIPRLEDLQFSNVNWIHQDPFERPPARIAPFLHLSCIKLGYGFSSPWRFLWLFHPMILRRCTSSSANIESCDAMLMTMITKAVCREDNDNFYHLQKLVYDSGRNELSVEDDYRIPILTFELWPVAPATLNNICSVIRIVKVTLRWDTYLDRDNAEWEAMDTAFAQKATSIEAFSIAIKVVFARISIKTIRSRVRAYFPRLIARGVVRMRITDRDEIRQDWRPVHPAHCSGSESTPDELDDSSESSESNIWDNSDNSGDSDDSDDLDDSETDN